MNATRSPRNRAYLAADITTATFFPRLVSSTSEPASTWSTMSASFARASAIVYVLGMPLMYIHMYGSSKPRPKRCRAFIVRSGADPVPAALRKSQRTAEPLRDRTVHLHGLGYGRGAPGASEAHDYAAI